MGYQESWVIVKPQCFFNQLVRAYEKAERSGFYELVGAQPKSVAILKRPIGELPAGTKVLWVCGDRCCHSVGGVFGNYLRCLGKVKVVPVEKFLGYGDSPLVKGIDFASPAPSENEYMKRYSADNYAYRLRAGQIR